MELAWSERGAGRVVLLIHDLAADARTLDGLADALRAEARVVDLRPARLRRQRRALALRRHDGRGAGRGRGRGPRRRRWRPPPSRPAPGSARSSRSTCCGATAAWCAPSPCPTRRSSSSSPRRRRASRPPSVACRRRSATGGPEAGVAAWLGGDADAAELARARAAHRAFYADWAGLSSWPATRPELRGLDGPAVVVTGPGTPEPVLAAADRLAALLPRSRRATGGDLAGAVRSLL